MKSSAKKVELASVDDLFSTEESRADAGREKVVEIPLSELHPFKSHPFKVKDDCLKRRLVMKLSLLEQETILLMKEKRSLFYGYRAELTGLINVLSLSQQKKPQNQKRYTISAKCPTASGQISWRKKSCLCWQITSPMMTAQIQQPDQRI